MFQISIPKPCNENWEKMTPTTKGAFCQSCAKEVVDFTKMTDDEVQHYFLDKTNGSICGRFKAAQLHRIKIELPETIFYQKIASWKKFMAIVLLAFGSMLFGCDVSTTKTNTEIILNKTPKNAKTKNDTICNSTMGTPALVQPDSLKTNHDKEAIVGALILPPIIVRTNKAPISDTLIFTGDIDFVRIDSIKSIPDSSNQLNFKPKIDTLKTVDLSKIVMGQSGVANASDSIAKKRFY